MIEAPEVAHLIESEFPAKLESIVSARRMVVAVAHDWRLAEHVVEDAALATSEFVTNVVFHAGTAIKLKARRLGSGIRIEVRDGNPELPTAGANDPADLLETRSMTGRGLALVAATADRWGADPEPGGKVVWAEIGTSRRMVAAADPPSFPPAAAPPRLGPEARSSGLTQVTGVAAQGRHVHLVGVPVRLLVESARQLSDLQREMQVMGLAQSAPVELRDLVSASQEIDAHIGHLRETGLDAAQAALTRGEEFVDVNMTVPEDAGRYLDRLATLLSRAASRLARRYLLTLPASREVVAYRRWWRDEVISQLAGRPPRPWSTPVTAEGS
ncbi:MAG TPA: ATP-binding protein [Acidimicrobiales bacterium]|nr:ATP-binding protein [Acidimicrobiales bacterium]